MSVAAAIPETDEERELREQQERLDAEDGNTKDGQAFAKQVDSPPEELLVAGTTQLGLFDAGGKRPTGSTLTVQGLGGIPIMQGQGFEKGTVIRGEFIAVVESVQLKDKVDRKAGVAVDCKQVHVAYASDVRISAAAGLRLSDDDSLAERVATVVKMLMSDDGSSLEDRVEAAVAVLRAA